MLRLLIRAIVWLVRAVFRSRDDLVLENLALRQQQAIYKDGAPNLASSIPPEPSGSGSGPRGRGGGTL